MAYFPVLVWKNSSFGRVYYYSRHILFFMGISEIFPPPIWFLLYLKQPNQQTTSCPSNSKRKRGPDPVTHCKNYHVRNFASLVCGLWHLILQFFTWVRKEPENRLLTDSTNLSICLSVCLPSFLYLFHTKWPFKFPCSPRFCFDLFWYKVPLFIPNSCSILLP